MENNITKDRNYFQSSMGDFGFRRIAAGETSPGGETYRVIVCLQEANINAESVVGDSLQGKCCLQVCRCLVSLRKFLVTKELYWLTWDDFSTRHINTRPIIHW